MLHRCVSKRSNASSGNVSSGTFYTSTSKDALVYVGFEPDYIVYYPYSGSATPINRVFDRALNPNQFMNISATGTNKWSDISSTSNVTAGIRRIDPESFTVLPDSSARTWFYVAVKY